MLNDIISQAAEQKTEEVSAAPADNTPNTEEVTAAPEQPAEEKNEEAKTEHPPATAKTVEEASSGFTYGRVALMGLAVGALGAGIFMLKRWRD